MLTTENKWLAARYGLEAPIMDLATGRRNRVPVAQLIRRTLRDVEPHARELGSERELEGVREILARGNGADRQLRVWNANRDIVEVVREISVATEARPSLSESVQSLPSGDVAERESPCPALRSSTLLLGEADDRDRLAVGERDLLVRRVTAPTRVPIAEVPARQLERGTRSSPRAWRRRSRPRGRSPG